MNLFASTCSITSVFILFAAGPLPAGAQRASAPRELGSPAAHVDIGVPTSVGDLPCSGGPGADFDWVVHAGEIFIFDTKATTVIGGPGGVPTSVQNTVGGLVEVRDLIVEEGGEIRAQGPHPFRICATRNVEIRGVIDVSGFKAKDVATLNTGNTVEVGAQGGPGGGKGGDANTNTMGSTPCGDPGRGPLEPFGEETLGGMGGESGYAPANLGKDARRPGGGGGGRFAADQGSLIAQNGFPGHPLSTGAKSGLMPASGGAAGIGPFADGDPSNDFFGVQPLFGPRGELAGLVRGELARLWAGYGGGGGGNAIPASTFPNPNWNFASDEKGGAGGGGGGALEIRALGKIVFGSLGLIRANGGRGATGENTYFLDHIGGSGGSGSGGHVLLESATAIDFTDGDPLTAPLRNWIEAVGGSTVIGPKGGGIPCGISHGGSGGPGVIQLHVPLAYFPPAANTSAGVVIPLAATAFPNPVGEITEPDPHVLLSSFDARAVASAVAGAPIRR